MNAIEEKQYKLYLTINFILWCYLEANITRFKNLILYLFNSNRITGISSQQ